MKKLDWQTWKETGVALQELRDSFGSILGYATHFPKTHKVNKNLRKSLKYLLEARYCLDDEIFIQYPEKEVRELSQMFYNRKGL